MKLNTLLLYTEQKRLGNFVKKVGKTVTIELIMLVVHIKVSSE